MAGLGTLDVNVQFSNSRGEFRPEGWELRCFVADELRADDEGRKLVGHASVFNSRATIFPGFKEEVAPGAFAQTIKKDDIRALWNHDTNLVLGRNTADTLSLREDKKGLAVEIDMPETQFANDALVSVKRGDVTQMSIGFRVLDREMIELDDDDDGGGTLRIIKRMKLFEVSPVAFPAFSDTDVAVRSIQEWRGTRAKIAIDDGFRMLRLIEAEKIGS